LAEGLANTGLVGHPREYFGTAAITASYWPDPVWRERLLDGDVSYLHRLIESEKTPTGLFGAKLHWSHCKVLLEALDRERLSGRLDPQVLKTAFPNIKLVWLRRSDKVRQAVSLFRAMGSGAWSQSNDDPQPAPPFDLASIYMYYWYAHTHEALWQRFFHRIGVEPLIVEYEYFVANYDQMIREVLEFVGAQPSADLAIPAPRLRRQSDAVTEEWIGRFLAADMSLEKIAPIIGDVPRTNRVGLPERAVLREYRGSPFEQDRREA
jgi:LPS sulfotransferase NodH